MPREPEFWGPCIFVGCRMAREILSSAGEILKEIVEIGEILKEIVEIFEIFKKSGRISKDFKDLGRIFKISEGFRKEFIALGMDSL